MPHRTRRLMLECHEQTIWESKGRDHCGATADDLLFLNPSPCCDCSCADAARIRDRGQHAFASNGRCPNPWQGGTSRGHAAVHQSLSAQASDLQRRLEDDDLLVLILFYCTMRELVRVIGR